MKEEREKKMLDPLQTLGKLLSSREPDVVFRKRLPAIAWLLRHLPEGRELSTARGPYDAALGRNNISENSLARLFVGIQRDALQTLAIADVGSHNEGRLFMPALRVVFEMDR